MRQKKNNLGCGRVAGTSGSRWGGKEERHLLWTRAFQKAPISGDNKNCLFSRLLRNVLAMVPVVDTARHNYAEPAICTRPSCAKGSSGRTLNSCGT